MYYVLVVSIFSTREIPMKTLEWQTQSVCPSKASNKANTRLIHSLNVVTSIISACHPCYALGNYQIFSNNPIQGDRTGDLFFSQSYHALCWRRPNSQRCTIVSARCHIIHSHCKDKGQLPAVLTDTYHFEKYVATFVLNIDSNTDIFSNTICSWQYQNYIKIDLIICGRPRNKKTSIC